MSNPIQKSKFIGCVLLIIGTSIGGGMLALPVATANAGFFNSLIFLIVFWFLMTTGALLILEVNLSLPKGSNIISMAKSTIGLPCAIVAWITYLFLLYALLSAYISGGSDVLKSILLTLKFNISNPLIIFIFTTIFGIIVYSGVKSVDYLNRGLMFVKLSVFILLIIIIMPYGKMLNLSSGNLNSISSSFMILVTSFGFASIVPTLREYFNNPKKLRKAIILGSLIPLICYILWDATIMSTVNREGKFGLMYLMQAKNPASGLTTALSTATKSNLITVFFSFFSAICMITAFLGVSIGLFDFLADGFKLKKHGVQGSLTFLLTFLPPLTMVLINSKIYLQALSYAGECCVILLLLLPTIMAWQVRKNTKNSNNILVPGGYIALSVILIIASVLLIVSIYNL